MIATALSESMEISGLNHTQDSELIILMNLPKRYDFSIKFCEVSKERDTNDLHRLHSHDLPSYKHSYGIVCNRNKKGVFKGLFKVAYSTLDTHYPLNNA